MYLIKNKKGLLLGNGEHGWRKLHEFPKLMLFPCYVTASQTAMKLGLSGDSVLPLDELVSNLLRSLSPLGEDLHDYLMAGMKLEDIALVGGLVEVKGMLAQALERQRKLEGIRFRLEHEVERLTQQLEAVRHLIQ